MSHDDALWERAIGVYREMAEAEPDDELAWLRERCGDNTALFDAVASMLESAPDDSRLLPALDDMLGVPAAHGSTDQSPLTIPGVELGRILGHGGSSDVYLGRQLSPERAVAVKILRSGLGTQRAKARFEQESRLLATLGHPGIASVYQAGTAAYPSRVELPYFLMELVRGRPLTESARELDAVAAARMLATVARAVHTAHQAGIVHRDLKPGNILIDNEGRPRILDFGIARLLDDETRSVHTNTGEVLGTLSYMSPEQLDHRVGRLDTRADVYALGVLFYEMLAGRPAIEQGSQSSLEAMTRILKGGIPRLDARSLGISTDFDAVYRRATETDPERRYDSAAAFADDLERLAEGRPVSARQPTTAYLLQRFAQRNPSAVVSIGLVAAAIIGFGALAFVGFLSASRERDAALQANARTDASSRFLRSMISSADPDIDGPDVRVIDLIDRWADTIDTESVGDPLVQFDLHRTIGWTYASLSGHDKAVHHLRQALRLGETGGVDFKAVLGLRVDMANSLVHTGDSKRAVEIARSVIDESKQHVELDPTILIEARIALGEALRVDGFGREAADEFETAISEADAQLGAGNPLARSALSGLGRSYLELQLAEAAVAIYERLVDENSREYGPDAPSTLIAKGNLATALNYTGEHERAVALFESVVGPLEAHLGAQHYDVRTFKGNMVDAFATVGRADDAVTLMESVVETERRIGGDEHQDTVVALNNYAVLLLELGKPEQAIGITQELIQLSDIAFGPDHPRSMLALRNHAQACEMNGRLDEAAEIQISLLERQRTIIGETEYDTLITHNNLGMLLNRLGRGDEAAGHLETVVLHTGADSGYPSFLYGIFLRNYAKCLLGAGRLEEADAQIMLARAADPENEEHMVKCDEIAEDVLEARRSSAAF